MSEFKIGDHVKSISKDKFHGVTGIIESIIHEGRIYVVRLDEPIVDNEGKMVGIGFFANQLELLGVIKTDPDWISIWDKN